MFKQQRQVQIQDIMRIVLIKQPILLQIIVIQGFS